MFPVYNSTVPHGHGHSHNHNHPHTTHPHTHTTHSHNHTTGGHQLSDHLTSPHSTNFTTSALTTATAASTLPLYSAYQLQQKAGYLNKEGDVWRTWKKRYFVLSSQLLSYYTDRDATQPKGHILLLGAEVRVSQRTDRSGWLFEVYRDEREADHRIYYMEAESEVERSEWMAAIKNNILYELNRTRALVDEVDRYRSRIQQLTDELERQKATQIVAELNKPHTATHSTHSTTTTTTTAAATAATALPPPAVSSVAVQHMRSPSSVELYDRLQYLEADNSRLLAENQSLKRSTLAMHGRGDEIRPTGESSRDEAVAAVAVVEDGKVSGSSSGSTSSGGGGSEESEVERLKRELTRVRMERGILKREVLRLMKVNDELTHPPPPTATVTTATQQPSQPSSTASV